jgi:hypothetical protein
VAVDAPPTPLTTRRLNIMPDHSKGNTRETSQRPALPSLTDPRMRRAIRFFAEHGASRPGWTIVDAVNLALAEWDAREDGCLWVWEEDADGWNREIRECFHLYPRSIADRERHMERLGQCEGCILYGPLPDEREHLASLWGMWDASPEYRRVVQAELAQEAGYGR